MPERADIRSKFPVIYTAPVNEVNDVSVILSKVVTFAVPPQPVPMHDPLTVISPETKNEPTTDAQTAFDDAEISVQEP